VYGHSRRNLAQLLEFRNLEIFIQSKKLFTSREINPKFADTGKAYLLGLAATDDPASLGTEMLTFSASAALPHPKGRQEQLAY